MKEKLFNGLKQAYAQLGLGDNILSGLADTIVATTQVTDENLQGIITGQKAFLEGVQKSNDKRVQDAVEKASKKADDTKAARIAELEKELEEAKKAQPTPPAPPKSDEIPDWYKAIQKANEEKEANYKKEIAALKKAKEDADREKSEAEAARAAKERSESINQKAKEKGIPDWIIKRGFASLPADADDAAIDTYLSEYAQDLKTNFLPGKGALAQPNIKEASKEEASAIAAKMLPGFGKKE